MLKLVRVGIAIVAACLLPTVASADMLNVTVSVQNLSPTNSLSFAPLRLGFSNGSFDAFNSGQTATAAIISVAEGGSASAWFPAFRAAEPNATLGSVGEALLPGQTASNTFAVDTAVNPFFTFASMLLPSNDHFIGNDSPTRFRLFDNAGNLLISSINQKARDIWDAGSEAFDPLNAAFLVIGNNDLRTPLNGVVHSNFTDLSGFNGLTTSAGYVFNSQLTADTDIYRLSFAASPVAVPAPPGVILGVIGMFMMGVVGRLRRKM